MSLNKTGKTISQKAAHKRKDRVAEITNTLEWLITAFMLAFVVRAFVMEAFRIPTGSMADTLKGNHFRLRCPQCGYMYDYGCDQREHGLYQNAILSNQAKIPTSRCPSCGYYNSTHRAIPISNGDRILVLKCFYQLFEPKQWDVIVFKNPLDPPTNYIKRLVGRPGETMEIIDGDIYINGLISQKPTKVQDELWMPVYDNDYQPARPREPFFNYHQWQQPFRNIAESKWKIDKDNPTLFHLNSSVDEINSLIYDTSIGNDFKTTYAYDDVKEYEHMPYCSDLMVRFYHLSDKPRGCIGISLSKYQTVYCARVDFKSDTEPAGFTGNMTIAKVVDNKQTTLDSKPIKLPAINKPALVKFANVDHHLIFQYGSQKLTYDLGRGPEDAGERRTDIPPQLKIFGSGNITLSHLAIFRDIYYTAKKPTHRPETGRATEGKSFTLSEDEFFVLGDNSPNSEDSRWWGKQGKSNNGPLYRQGIVPRDYLVGKALFVYWPSGFEFPWPQSLKTFLLKNSQHNRLLQMMHLIVSLRWIPNIGQMRFIHGGSGDNI
ncbi:MAG: signal peptidase I [Planctomycetota bacterium]|nr:MAG: signal peptidase I [Planctomycetota bacterium]